MSINEELWKFYQNHLEYSDEEMKIFKENPRNEEVIKKAAELMNHTIIVKVVDSHGCNSQHKVGDKFYFDGAGNLITKLCPKRICIYALNSMATGIFTSNELFYVDVDPNEMLFKRFGCFDVGVQCGGWGRVIMEISVEERKKIVT
ncbi:MAG: hypothetical protein ACW99F_01110 [Candidatus Hodarchaeales archaeon]|jgi:uncharacterized repeat protein (TIGR04076 family)